MEIWKKRKLVDCLNIETSDAQTFYDADQLHRNYSYEIRSWLLQGMRDAIVSGSCLV
jgi:hypothetical protein